MNFRKVDLEVFITPEEAAELGDFDRGILAKIVRKEDLGFDGEYSEKEVPFRQLNFFDSFFDIAKREAISDPEFCLKIHRYILREAEKCIKK